MMKHKAVPYLMLLLLSLLAALAMMASLRSDAMEKKELQSTIESMQVWYYDELDYARDRYAGENDSYFHKSEFRPYGKMTRSEMRAMIGMLDTSGVADIVPEGGGHEGVTRLDVSRWIYRLISENGYDSKAGSAGSGKAYVDTDELDPNEIYRLGILNTQASGGSRKFHPNMEMTRIEGVMIINRAYAFLHEPDKLKALNGAYGGAEEIPVLMYHSVDDMSSSWSYTTVPTLKLENDVRQMISSGYRGASFSEVIAHIDGFKPMDYKPFLVTFDDGYMDNYSNAFKVLKKYRVPSLISFYRLDDGHLTKEERAQAKKKLTPDAIREMDRTNLVEFGNHSYNFHKIDKATGRKMLEFKAGETVKEYRKRATDDMARQNEAVRGLVGYTPAVFTYPFGYYNKELVDCVGDMGFRASLSTVGGVWNVESDGLFSIKRMNVSYNMRSSNVVKAIGD